GGGRGGPFRGPRRGGRRGAPPPRRDGTARRPHTLCRRGDGETSTGIRRPLRTAERCAAACDRSHHGGSVGLRPIQLDPPTRGGDDIPAPAPQIELVRHLRLKGGEDVFPDELHRAHHLLVRDFVGRDQAEQEVAAGGLVAFGGCYALLGGADDAGAARLEVIEGEEARVEVG